MKLVLAMQYNGLYLDGEDLENFSEDAVNKAQEAVGELASYTYENAKAFEPHFTGDQTDELLEYARDLLLPLFGKVDNLELTFDYDSN